MTAGTYGETDVMRHIPPLDRIIAMVQEDRRRVEVVHRAIFDPTDRAAEATQRAEAQLAAVCRWLERVAEAVRGAKRSGPETSLFGRTQAAFDHALEALATISQTDFRRRASYNQFDKSKCEPILGTVLAVHAHVDTLVATAAALDRDLLMKMNEPIFPQFYTVVMRETVAAS